MVFFKFRLTGGVFIIALIALTPDIHAQKAEKLITPTSFYLEPGTYGTKRETHPPDYVRDFGLLNSNPKSWLKGLKLGLDYRVRAEMRHNDIRRDAMVTDWPFLLRSRAYVGIHEGWGPFRWALELEDAHRVNGRFASDTRDFNRHELIQSYAELHFLNVLPKDRGGNQMPVFLRFGRQAFEMLDRRLIGLNRWRNTTNTFYGFRAALGGDHNAWHLDALLMNPIERSILSYDQPNYQQTFGAVIGHWRTLQPQMVFEPFVLWLDQRKSESQNLRARRIVSPGLRVYGKPQNGAFHYELNGIVQFGEDGSLQHKAFAFMGEVGYAVKHWPHQPKLGLFYGFVSGDKSPNDQENNRFERFFGFARPWSADDYIIMENIQTLKFRVETKWKKGVRADAGYGFYWLASANDRFANLLNGNGNRDLTGESGRFVGHGFDARVLFKPVGFVSANIGLALFSNGGFVQHRQEAVLGESEAGSQFVYVELMFNVLDVFQKKAP